MIFKRNILTKILSNGIRADFALVNDEGEFKALLYINRRPVPGPPLPEMLTPPKDETTYWMGNKPGVGLTDDEAEKIINAVKMENRAAEHRRKLQEHPGFK
jgi:hypothetical protein